jgi:hypothetical protein
MKLGLLPANFGKKKMLVGMEGDEMKNVILKEAVLRDFRL